MKMSVPSDGLIIFGSELLRSRKQAGGQIDSPGTRRTGHPDVSSTPTRFKATRRGLTFPIASHFSPVIDGSCDARRLKLVMDLDQGQGSRLVGGLA